MKKIIFFVLILVPLMYSQTITLKVLITRIDLYDVDIKFYKNSNKTITIKFNNDKRAGFVKVKGEYSYKFAPLSKLDDTIYMFDSVTITITTLSHNLVVVDMCYLIKKLRMLAKLYHFS